MPMIDVYATGGTFADPGTLARDLETSSDLKVACLLGRDSDVHRGDRIGDLAGAEP
jgi:hypothetical protein